MSEMIVEILDDAHATSLVADGAGTTRLEIEVQQDVTVHSLTVQEFIEVSEQGPTGNFVDGAGLIFILHDGVEYAERITVTADPTRVVVWVGPVPPTIDGTYALNNVDVWWNTSV